MGTGTICDFQRLNSCCLYSEVGSGEKGIQMTTPSVVPPVLYVAIRTRNEGTEMAAEIRELRNGRQALLTYSSLDRLLDLAGPNQAWIVMRTDELDTLKKEQPFDVVIFDLEVPEMYRADGAIA